MWTTIFADAGLSSAVQQIHGGVAMRTMILKKIEIKTVTISQIYLKGLNHYFNSQSIPQSPMKSPLTPTKFVFR